MPGRPLPFQHPAGIFGWRLGNRVERGEDVFAQRTTLDDLNVQQALLNARVNLVTSQRGRVVVACALLAAVGCLSASPLNLDVATYDPSVNLNQLKWKLIGLSTSVGQ